MSHLHVLVASLLLLPLARSAGPQSIIGSVANRTDSAPLHDALVSLIDTTGGMVAAVRTDRRGRYTINVPGSGVYAVVASNPGFKRVVSGWLEVTASETLDVKLRLDRQATVLSPIVVSAQRDSLMEFRVRGVPLKTLAGSVITQAEFKQASEGTTRTTEAIQNLRIPTVYLKSFEVSVGDPRVDGFRTCLTFIRTDGCITIVIDGLRLSSDDQLFHLDEVVRPEQVKGMVMLRPAEAWVLFGTDTANGVLLIITKTGSR
ncbi:MAG: carboxypeptidase regulatory-like domain-containing protein [Gemmatimonadota bacterium]